MTSANVFYLTVFDKEDDRMGTYRYNMLTKFDYKELLIYTPYNQYTVTLWGYDEDEDVWEDDPINLEEFLKQTKTI